MLWELLVTDGHVRATRLRRLQPWIIALGFLLLWAGIMIIRMGPDLKPGVSAAAKLQQRLANLQQWAQTTVQQVPPLTLPADAQKSLPPAKEVAELVAVVLKSLNDSGDLPEDDVKFKKLDDATAFWKGDWGIEQVDYWREGDDILVAGNVSTGTASYPQPARWIGLFHRGRNKDGKKVWVYASVVGSNQFAPRELPYVSPTQVPLSLEPFLPDQPAPKKAPRH